MVKAALTPMNGRETTRRRAALRAAAVPLLGLLDDGEAGAAAAAGAGVIDLVEALEDARQVLRRDADACIADLDHQPVAGPLRGHGHGAAFRRELDRVVHQVAQRPLQAS